MKMPVLLTGLILLYSAVSAQTVSKAFTYEYVTDSVPSAHLNGNRAIKISLPAGYQKGNKYPVIFVLDENWMFEPTVKDVTKLAAFEVIPPCIVVGINSPNRSLDLTPNLTTGAFTPTNKNFFRYLTEEVPQYIARKYTPSSFSILIGHSDGATFAQNAMTQNPDAYRGVICLSQNLFGNELEQYVQFCKTPFAKNHYYFVASGTRDATPRISSGKRLDSVFNTQPNQRLKTRHELYNADHSGVAGIGLANGIAFVFSDYAQPNDWNAPLVDSLKRIKMDPVTLINSTMQQINDNYGLEAKPGENGVTSLAFAIVTDKHQAASYLDYRLKNTKTNDQFNSSAAQLYERIKEYDIALEYWTKYLNDPQSYKSHFFYFRRPIELLAYKMNDPKRAIIFAEEWEKKAPDNVKPSFKYFIAKIAADKNTSAKKGKAAIEDFIKHHDPAKTQYTLEDAQKIKVLLEGKK